MSIAIMMPPSSSFSAYVSWAQMQTNISEEEEKSLLLEYTNKNDLSSVKKLLISHLKYVISIAGGYIGYGLPLQDLVQEGNIGLMKAVKRFDLIHAVRFATFAMYWIKSEIHEYIIRNWRIVKVATTKNQRKLFFRLRKQLDYEQPVQANLKSIAQQAGVSLHETQIMHARMLQYEESLEASVNYNDDTSVTLGEILSLPGDNPMQRVISAQQVETRTEYLNSAIKSLNDREQWIISQRWLTKTNTKTLEFIAKHLGISIERARQLEVQALKRMRKFLLDNKCSYADAFTD